MKESAAQLTSTLRMSLSPLLHSAQAAFQTGLDVLAKLFVLWVCVEVACARAKIAASADVPANACPRAPGCRVLIHIRVLAALQARQQSAREDMRVYGVDVHGVSFQNLTFVSRDISAKGAPEADSELDREQREALSGTTHGHAHQRTWEAQCLRNVDLHEGRGWWV